MDYFTGEGILTPDQVDGSYDGTPALFVADEGKAAQQGFGSAEPYLYENEVAELDEAGRVPVHQRRRLGELRRVDRDQAGEHREYADCFTKLVPIIQQSSIDYLERPGRGEQDHPRGRRRVRQRLGVRRRASPTTQSRPSRTTASSPTVPTTSSATSTWTVSTTSSRRRSPIYTALGQPPKEGLTAEDIVTNQFIDESIGLWPTRPLTRALAAAGASRVRHRRADRFGR